VKLSSSLFISLADIVDVVGVAVGLLAAEAEAAADAWRLAVRSCPHAAMMSRPRGQRMGASMLASCRIFWKARIVSSGEHSNRVPGQVLNGLDGGMNESG
jgi:hypothetical protein